MENNNLDLGGQVLLRDYHYDLEAFQVQFHDDWKIELEGMPITGQYSFTLGDALIAIMVVPMRCEEAESACGKNYSWVNSRQEVAAHRSHVSFAVLNCPDPLRRHVLFTMVAVTLMKQDNVIGLYTYPTVHKASDYIEQAAVMKDNDLPVGLWVFIGVYPEEDGRLGCYTFGLENFGLDEMEILHCSADVLSMYDFMQRQVKQCIALDRKLKAGDVIPNGMMEQVTVSRSEAVAFDGESLKLNYRNA